MEASFEVLLAGHSHINALVGSFSPDTPTVRIISQEKSVAVLDGSWPRSQVFWDALYSHANQKTVCLMWGGNEHNSLYFFQEAFEFDFLSSFMHKMLQKAQIISRRTVKDRYYKLSLSEMEGVCQEICARHPRKLVVLGTPPPKANADKLRAMFAAEPHFQDWAVSIGLNSESVKITDALVRLKLWHELQSCFREIAERCGGTFISVPADVMDDDGFLKEEYWASDVTHANDLYGQIMLRYVLREVIR